MLPSARRVFALVLTVLLPGVVHTSDSDGDGISDSVDASSGSDPNTGYAVSIGDGNACALDDSGSVCWGYQVDSAGSFYGGGGPLLGAPPWKLPEPFPSQISHSYVHYCWIGPGGVGCDGWNEYGQTDVPRFLSNPQHVSVGAYHTCAIDESNVICWGIDSDSYDPNSSYYGQADVPIVGDFLTQTPISQKVSSIGPDLYFQIEVPSNARNLTISTSGGTNVNGDVDVELWADPIGERFYSSNSGNEETLLIQFPPAGNYYVTLEAYSPYENVDLSVTYDQITTPWQPVGVVAGLYHTCALDEENVTCWGRNDSGQTDAPALVNPKAIAVGAFHSCAIDDTGVVCWGASSLTYTDIGYTFNPLDVPQLNNPRAITAGVGHTCALDDDGIKCWGDNRYGSTDVPDLINPTALDASIVSTCAITDRGVACWGGYGAEGYNYYASLVATPPSELMFDPDGDGVTSQYGQDAFPNDPAESTDTDNDGVGNNADTDDDNDGVPDSVDAFPLNAGESADTDGDGIGNNSDSDDDNDGVPDAEDAFPLDASETQDADNDGIGNNADLDDDNDGLNDTLEIGLGTSPVNPDSDQDGVSDGVEVDSGTNPLNADTDGDGVGDKGDVFPLDATEFRDTDLDGIGNNADIDDDNDGLSDLAESELGTNPLKKDTDGDGLSDGQEVELGLNPLVQDECPEEYCPSSNMLLKILPRVIELRNQRAGG